MFTLTLIVIWLGLIDSINPSLIVIAFFLLLSREKLWGYILGIFLAILLQFFVLDLGLEKVAKIFSWAKFIHWELIMIFLGGILIVYGFYSLRQKFQLPKSDHWQCPTKSFHDASSSLKLTTHFKDLLLGGMTTLAEAPMGFLQVLVVVEIQRFNVNPLLTHVYFIIYSLLYTLPIILLNVLALCYAKPFKSWVQGRLQSLYVRINIALNVTFIALGCLLIIFAAQQLLT
ncbi:GAP family protein [Gloeothece verrucosa]|uniref:Sap, sulfolipid-1-addressing protein n=1 Tax=Gloeothece verrucosa (strain PCC 7822) TaxID=497965 RepID=E0U777_GLOV7|nr:GAP family protein [Gloeothece verrucosa]ADN12464.1 conserved hypothetical protein [Gloeothece verrucosa PCC 7822]